MVHIRIIDLVTWVLIVLLGAGLVLEHSRAVDYETATRVGVEGLFRSLGH